MYRYHIYLLPLLPLLFGLAFHLQLVLLSYHSIFLRSYHFLKLVSFLGANRTKSASVCLWLLRGATKILEYNTIDYKKASAEGPPLALREVDTLTKNPERLANAGGKCWKDT